MRLTAEKQRARFEVEPKTSGIHAHVQSGPVEATAPMTTGDDHAWRQDAAQGVVGRDGAFDREIFAAIIETLPEGVLVVDSKKVVRFANPAAALIFGYSRQELAGRCLDVLLPGWTPEENSENELQGRHRRGESIWLEVTTSGLGTLRSVFLRDVTARRVVQQELEESREKLRLIPESIPGLIYSRSPDGRVTYANRRAVEFFGMELEDICNGSWIEALHPEEKAAVLAAIEENFARGEPYTMEYRRRRFDGVYRWFQTSVQPLRDSTGRVTAWYGLLTDIHDRRIAEESLRSIQLKLAEASQKAALSEFAAAVIHEISQPLSCMIANGEIGLEWLSAVPLPQEKVRTVIEDLVKDGRDARAIIDGLRSLFRRTPPRKVPLALPRLAGEVMTLVQSRFGSEPIEFVVQVPDDLPAALGDQLQLQQVLVNLLTNAVEAMQGHAASPAVILRMRQEGSMILTEVEDRGPGIIASGQIFETFFTTREDGLGMGLPISRSIIQAHSGQLWHQPAPAGGAIFCFTVPAHQPQSETPAP